MMTITITRYELYVSDRTNCFLFDIFMIPCYTKKVCNCELGEGKLCRKRKKNNGESVI